MPFYLPRPLACEAGVRGITYASLRLPPSTMAVPCFASLVFVGFFGCALARAIFVLSEWAVFCGFQPKSRSQQELALLSCFSEGGFSEGRI